MHKCLAICLTVLILLQSFSRELVVADYLLHKERITQLFCVNRGKPQLHCNGKCHLRKQLTSAAAEKKTPDHTLKPKLDVALPSGQVAPARPIAAVGGERQYRPLPGFRYGYEQHARVFRPPLS